jgi:glycosyltransferase involved in cell wall biosynthesis
MAPPPLSDVRGEEFANVRDGNRRLRVGIITDGLEERRQNGQVTIANGGVGTYIYNLVTHLRTVSPDTEIVLIKCGAAELDLYRHDGQRTVVLRGRDLVRTACMLDMPYARLVRTLRLDLLHYPNQFGGAFLPMSIPRVVTLHDLTPLLFPQFHPSRRVAGYRLLLRRALARARHVIVDATHTKQDLVRRGLAAAQDISVIPLGVASAFGPSTGLRTGSAHDSGVGSRYDLPERYVLTVGVFEPRKNQVALLRAVQRLHAQGEPIAVVMVGRDGWRWKDPLETPELSTLRPWIRMLRNVSDADLVAIYKRAAVFAYPSLYEGFGLPVLEAMACGTPVVASNRSSLPEVAGDAAVLVDPTDTNAFAAALRTVLRDDQLRQQLVQAGLARARMFSWDQTAERTLAIYARVARSSHAAHASRVH